MNGYNALVGGSTQGIGLAIARALNASGANVTLIARNEEKLEEITKGLKNADYIVADFLKPDQVKSKVESHGKQFHILVNNTGGPPGGRAIDAKPEEFLTAFKQHLICNQILVQHSVPFMKKERYGRIINIISTSVKQPIPMLGVSNTIRGAVANWAKTLANELGEFGITVNNILPGTVRTGRLISIIQDKAKREGKALEMVEQEMIETIPAKRFASPEELAYAAVFLASPQASYINGINLPVDGGRTKSL